MNCEMRGLGDPTCTANMPGRAPVGGLCRLKAIMARAYVTAHCASKKVRQLSESHAARQSCTTRQSCAAKRKSRGAYVAQQQARMDERAGFRRMDSNHDSRIQSP